MGLNHYPIGADTTLVRSLRFGALAAMLGLATAAVAASVLFSSALGGEAVAERAVVSIEVETALSSVVGARAAVQQAVLFSAASTEELAAGARLTADQAIDVMADRVSHLPGDLRPTSSAELENTLRAVLAELVADDVDGAAELLDTAGAALSVEVVADLEQARDSVAADLAAAGDSASRIATGTRFVIGLAVPALAVGGIWLLYRRREEDRRMVERLEAERTLRKSQDAFIANVSHELRTPLTTILGFAHLLDTNVVAEPAERADLVRLVYGEAAELARMVDDLLIAARVKAGELAYRFEPVEVRPEVAEVVGAFIRAGREIDIDVEPGKALVDRLRLRQIIRNLVANGTRYGGERLAITGRVVGDCYRITVADNGAGLDAEAAAGMFERFVGVEDSSLERGGLGLGLSVVKTLTEDMHGTVVYERDESETRFIVEFPLASTVAVRV